MAGAFIRESYWYWKDRLDKSMKNITAAIVGIIERPRRNQNSTHRLRGVNKCEPRPPPQSQQVKQPVASLHSIAENVQLWHSRRISAVVEPRTCTRSVHPEWAEESQRETVRLDLWSPPPFTET